MNVREGMDRMLGRLAVVMAPQNRPTHRIKWKARECPCILTTERRGEIVDLGGEIAEVALSAIVRVSDLEPFLDASHTTTTADTVEVLADNAVTRPVANHELNVTTRNRTYRIIRTELDGPESHYTLDLADIHNP